MIYSKDLDKCSRLLLLVNTDNPNKPMNIGCITIRCGSWVATGTGDSYVLMVGENDLPGLLGIPSGAFMTERFSCVVHNGDAAVNGLTCIGTQYYKDDGLYCYLSGTLPIGSKIRLNFIYFYFDGYNSIS